MAGIRYIPGYPQQQKSLFPIGGFGLKFIFNMIIFDCNMFRIGAQKKTHSIDFGVSCLPKQKTRRMCDKRRKEKKMRHTTFLKKIKQVDIGQICSRFYDFFFNFPPLMSISHGWIRCVHSTKHSQKCWIPQSSVGHTWSVYAFYCVDKTSSHDGHENALIYVYYL